MSKVEAPIKLHHFGEDLISGLINELGFDLFLKFLNENAFCPHKDSTLKDKMRLQKIGAISLLKPIPEFAKSMVKLELSDSKWETDTEHDIDVALFGENGNCFPIEVKMGTTGVVESWAKFRTYMEDKPMRLRELYSYTYVDGAMSSFLAGLNHTGSPKIVNSPKWDTWGLCIRQKNKKLFFKTDVDSNITNLPLIFTFEELIEFFDDNKGKGTHKNLIHKILDNSKAILTDEIDECLKLVKG